ncbi:MAG: hypothetical protein CMI54_00250 [Parcubacteria group bacterium]|nr:hypothetical protein [Parcubacteria group bacterium]|tara:strand:- start:26195 stop:28021 length:1827 start_codon:yes stop_codon:yes gene_type:complete
MWYCPDKYKIEPDKINEKMSEIEGFLSDKEAKITLAQFLHANIGFTTELISGIKLATYQEVTLKGMMNRNFSMCVWGRGCGKTFIASVFCFLQCIFNPGTKILVAGPTFRTARFIFSNLEKMVESKGAELLMQCFGAKIKRNDQFEWQINEGSVTAIPLNGEKIRGFRANVLLLDEYLLLPEDLINTVLMPFLVAPQNMKERIEIREMEDKLIEQKVMKEKDRMVFENDSKMIALSSASYTFENLYKTYQDWVNKIYEKGTGDASYFVSQLGYETLPEHMIDHTIIEAAQDGGSSNASFQREYCAQFTDGSDSYFSAIKMHGCTIPDGEEPTTLIKGRPNKKYVVGIDPNMSDSPSADYFGISVMEVNDEKETATLVHNYAGLGNLNKHVQYLYYILESFDPVLISVDNAGADMFLEAANNSKLFIDNRVNLKTIEFDSNKEGADYIKQVRDFKRTYNKENRQIAFNQVFSSDWIRKANELLQANIDYKKIWFASRTSANGSEFDKQSTYKINLKQVNEENMGMFIETQDNLVYQVKKQCALVEVKTTARGTQTFDLPQHLKRNTSAHRARKDNYTALLLANWAVKCYFDMQNYKLDEGTATFVPRMV